MEEIRIPKPCEILTIDCFYYKFKNLEILQEFKEKGYLFLWKVFEGW